MFIEITYDKEGVSRNVDHNEGGAEEEGGGHEESFHFHSAMKIKKME